MNRLKLYEFVTSLLDDFEMEDTLFNSFLDVAQMNRENARPWVILRTIQSSQTITTANTYLTALTLPTDFKKFFTTRASIVLTDSQGNLIKTLREVPLSSRHSYKNDGGKFYVNYSTRQIFICGSQSQTATVNISYIKKTTKISAADANKWEFSSYDDYEKILGFDIAVMHKLGVDYDQTNAQQGNNNAAQAQIILNMMIDWDNELALSAQQGVDYNTNPGSGFSELSGNAGNLIG